MGLKEALGGLVVNTGRFITFIQVLFYLPLTLHIAGRPTFLSLSLTLTLYYALLSFTHLLTRRTPLSGLSILLASTQPVFVPLALLWTFHLHAGADPAAPDAVGWAGRAFERLLRWSSPTFYLLEGAATLLVIQSANQISRVIVRNRGEGASIVFLVLSSAIYVVSGLSILSSYPSAAAIPISATLLGACATATLALSAAGLMTRRTSVVETSLMAAYIAYSIWLCGDAIEGVGGWGGLQWGVGGGPGWVVQSFSTAWTFLTTAFGDSLDFITAALATLPPPLLTSLIFRCSVLSLASRIIPALKRSHAAGAYYTDEDDGYGGRGLGDEEPSEMVMTVLVAFARMILVCVYSHLLLLDQGAQLWWRWANVFWTLFLWATELLLSKDEEEVDGAALAQRWKID